MTVAELKAELAKYPDECEVKYTVDPLNDVTPWCHLPIDKVSSCASTTEELDTAKATVLLIG